MVFWGEGFGDFRDGSGVFVIVGLIMWKVSGMDSYGL